jgi:hypothetical protein
VLYFVKEKTCSLAHGFLVFTLLGCHPNGYHPKEALVKSNYKQYMHFFILKTSFLQHKSNNMVVFFFSLGKSSEFGPFFH